MGRKAAICRATSWMKPADLGVLEALGLVARAAHDYAYLALAVHVEVYVLVGGGLGVDDALKAYVFLNDAGYVLDHFLELGHGLS
jgi:hypothetical protein